MVSPTLHFIWGYKADDVFGLVERIAIQSAAHHHPGWQVILWAHRQPEGEQWEKLVAKVPRIRVVGAPAADVWNGRRLEKYQHRADLLRYTALYALGGAYLDLDTITLSPFPDWWLQKDYTVGLEYMPDGRVIGLCNAIYLCAPYSRFGWRVLQEFQQFDPQVHGYAEFGVNRPYLWAQEQPADVNIVKWSLLGPMHWDSARYWQRHEPLPGVVVAHLWRTHHNDQMLRALTETDLREGSFWYAVEAARFL